MSFHSDARKWYLLLGIVITETNEWLQNLAMSLTDIAAHLKFEFVQSLTRNRTSSYFFLHLKIPAQLTQITQMNKN